MAKFNRNEELTEPKKKKDRAGRSFTGCKTGT